MKSKKFLTAILVSALSLCPSSTGCKKVVYEDSPKQYIPGQVVSTQLIPSHLEQTTGIDSEGNVSFKLEVIDDFYEVEIVCDDRIYQIEGESRKHKSLFKIAQKWKELEVPYTETTKYVYDDLDKDGKKELVETKSAGRNYFLLDSEPAYPLDKNLEK